MAPTRQNSFAVLSDEPTVVVEAVRAATAVAEVSSSKKSGTYLPPSKREVDPLAPENFPALGGAKSTPDVNTKPNFLQRIQAAEEERQRAAEAELYDPDKLEAMNRRQLEKEGWAVLSLSSAAEKVYAAEFYKHLNTIENPNEKVIPTKVEVAIPQDYYSDDEESEDDTLCEEDQSAEY